MRKPIVFRIRNYILELQVRMQSPRLLSDCCYSMTFPYLCRYWKLIVPRPLTGNVQHLEGSDLKSTIQESTSLDSS